MLLNHPISINEEKIAVQIGRTVLTFAMKYMQVEANLPKLNGKFSNSNNNNNNKQIMKKASSTNYDRQGFYQKHRSDLLYD